jgi:hypothetical protein
MGALEQTLGLGVTRVEDDPADGELAAEAGELLRGSTAARVDRPLTVPDELLRQGAQRARQLLSWRRVTSVGAPGDALVSKAAATATAIPLPPSFNPHLV